MPPKLLLTFLYRVVARATPALMVLALGLITVACAPYTVIVQSGPPSALAGSTTMAIKYDYSQVAISNKRLTEQQWLDSREKDEHRNTYLETKESANKGVAEGLTKKIAGVAFTEGDAPAGTVQATVFYTEWEEGMYAGVVAWPSKITARVQFSKDGAVIDEIQMHIEEQASLYTPAPQQRLHTIGKKIGEYTAHYIINTTK